MAEPTRAAVYAQARRDNENEARELLLSRLGEKHIYIDAMIETRGDLNFTTKVLVTTLLYFDPCAQIPAPFDRKTYSSTSAEYNQLRRTNEREVCGILRKRIAEHILEQDFMQLSHFNPTTKIIIASARYMDDFEGHVLKQEADSDIQMDLSPTNLSSTAVEPSSIDTSDLPDFPSVTRQTTIPDSDDEDIPCLLPPPPRSSFPQIETDGTVDRAATRSSKRLSIAGTDAIQHIKSEYNLRPPPLKSMTAKKRSKSPPRNADTTRPWEETEPRIPWDMQPIQRHPVEQIEQLEQVAKRLLAKAKDMIEPGEETTRRGYAVRSADISDEQLRDIEWISDLMIDALTVIEDKGEKMKKMKKWAAEQAKWAEEYELQ
ncbi:hypothetical protein PMZ80_010448 [Knufia obscura]|uniref:Uncharacterized protein n=1 Tax=Knufia obscura TaxID=1635080 RepID=A0ABR0R9X1_9EURO|nr:hypothetical protein PMZ80_010448 [Knufia obscura]